MLPKNLYFSFPLQTTVFNINYLSLAKNSVVFRSTNAETAKSFEYNLSLAVNVSLYMIQIHRTIHTNYKVLILLKGNGSKIKSNSSLPQFEKIYCKGYVNSNRSQIPTKVHRSKDQGPHKTEIFQLCRHLTKLNDVDYHISLPRQDYLYRKYPSVDYSSYQQKSQTLKLTSLNMDWLPTFVNYIKISIFINFRIINDDISDNIETQIDYYMDTLCSSEIVFCIGFCNCLEFTASSRNFTLT